MTVDEMLSRMTSIELEEWKAYMTLENDSGTQDELSRRAEEGLRARKAAKGRR